jgi:hypothetical protein
MNILVNFHNKKTAHYEEHSIAVAQIPSFGLRMARKGYKMVLIDDTPAEQWIRQYHQPKAA